MTERPFTPNPSITIIAEAGVNHNGSLEMARRMVRVAAEAGADLVKFQTFTAQALVSAAAPKAEYQMRTTPAAESQLAMLQRLELNPDDHRVLMQDCREQGIGFLSTLFDLHSVDLLAALGLQLWKIPSGEITNPPYLRKIGALNQQVILSTGMAELAEALGVLRQAGTPRSQIIVLQCNTEYPTPMADMNLRAMLTMQAAFSGVRVGYSDHTTGIEVPIAAAALGAAIVEKHFTLDRSLAGPDHRASLAPEELKAMVMAIRNVEQALGDGVKRPSLSEVKNKPIAGKSIVAAAAIRKGDVFTARNLTVKRPGTGISPMRWDEVMGQIVERDYAGDELI